MSPETGAFGLSPFVTVKPPIKLTNADYDDLYHEHGMYDPQTKQYEKYKGGFDIERRSGVQERRFFSENTNKVAIASECLDRLMQATDASRRNTVFLLASSRPDIQNIAEKVHTKMNVDGEGINWACSTFAAAIRQAIDVHRGQKDVAIVTLEMWGDLINILDRNMCLFGDGVYGTLLTEDTSRQMLRVHDAHVEFYDPESVDRAATGDVIVQSTQNALGPTRRMSKHNAFSINGRLIYRVAPKKMLATAEEGLRANNTDLQEIDALLPHGANLNMVELILEALN